MKDNIITIIKNAPSITEGVVRSTLNLRTPIMEYREKNYCKKCPVSHKDGVYTGMCTKALGGCGCKTKVKTSQNKIPCPKGFWGSTWFKEDNFKEFINKNPIK